MSKQQYTISSARKLLADYKKPINKKTSHEEIKDFIKFRDTKMREIRRFILEYCAENKEGVMADDLQNLISEMAHVEEVEKGLLDFVMAKLKQFDSRRLTPDLIETIKNNKFIIDAILDYEYSPANIRYLLLITTLDSIKNQVLMAARKA